MNIINIKVKKSDLDIKHDKTSFSHGLKKSDFKYIAHFVTIKEVENKLDIYFNNNKIASIIEDTNIKEIFKRRKSFKGLILKTVEDGEFLNVSISIIRYCDIHGHSAYSLLDGAVSEKKKAILTEYSASLTDHGNMFGTLSFYKYMKAINKKPIVGLEAYCETIDGEKNGNHLILIAKNKQGFKNLCKLSSLSYYNFYKKPHISYELLKKYKEGLICTSACIKGELGDLLKDRQINKAKEVIRFFKSLFKDDYYIEIQNHHFDLETQIMKNLRELAKEENIKCIATVDSHYAKKEDSLAQEVLLCLSTKKLLTEPHMKFSGEGYYIHSSADMLERFKGEEELLDNSLEIEDKCEDEIINLNKLYMPKFQIPKNFKSDYDYFEKLCRDGYDFRFKNTDKYENKVYREEFEYELKMIKKMKYAGYFLIVWDYINYAKSHDVAVGPGRGSCVGALIAYCLRITEVNPIPLGLLFERFLNPERISMPDIDTDFDNEGRPRVIDYVKKKYGEKCVSRIITFGTMASKMVIRDVGRVLDIPLDIIDKLAKAIPDKASLSDAMDVIDFKSIYDSNKDVQKLVKIALVLENLPRHCSQHACGEVITPSDVSNYLPTILLKNKDGEKEVTTQFSEVEEMGLLKMDFLGLRNMGVIKNCIELINKKNKNKKITLDDFYHLKMYDRNVYKNIIATGKTFGVFQLESPGMVQFMKDLFSDVSQIKEEDLPQLFERLIAGISLYRPGPMDSIPEYLENMKHPENIKYDTKELKPLLKNTYGIIVYQESVMQIVRNLAGYSLGRSDIVRKAMGHKKKDIMEKEEEIFINGLVDDKTKEVKVDGCLRRGIDKDVAKKTWNKMSTFAEYAFNKSHASAYAVIAYITAYLSYYYPLEFMASILNSEITKSDKLKIYLSSLRKKNIKLLPPDINKSDIQFTVEDKKIRFGLMGLRNMGTSSRQVLEERNKRGEFKNYQDFAERMAKHQKIDKKILEALIYSGTVDSFEGSRRAKLFILGTILNDAKHEKKIFESGQLDLFSMNDEMSKLKEIHTPKYGEFDKKIKLSKEKEYAGLYISEHPLDAYDSILKQEQIIEIADILPYEDMDETLEAVSGDDNVIVESKYNDKNVTIAGIVKNVKLLFTKKDNKEMYLFTIEDRGAEINCVLFNSRVATNANKMIDGKIVILQGRVKDNERGIQIIADNLSDIEFIKKSETPKVIWCKVFNKQQINKLILFIKNHQGNIPVCIRYRDYKNFRCKYNINYTLSNCNKLKDFFGENMKIVYMTDK